MSSLPVLETSAPTWSKERVVASAGFELTTSCSQERSHPQRSASGKQKQRYFSTREKAKEFAADLRETAKEHGKASASISTRLAEEARKAVGPAV
ncbi:hypothetical protein [Haloferula sp.]|uniref:hypothetical protein n=1 Tax=Haloferula sp. TaxID=2497595 RepID=UPI0032A05F5E